MVKNLIYALLICLVLVSTAHSTPKVNVECSINQEGDLNSYNYTFTNSSASEIIYTLGILSTTDNIIGLSSFYDPIGQFFWQGQITPVEYGGEKYFAITWTNSEGFHNVNGTTGTYVVWFASEELFPTQIDFNSYDYGNTVGPIDNIPPMITNIRSYDITGSSANIRWTTDEKAISIIKFGETDLMEQQIVDDGKAVLRHEYFIEDLSPSTTYYFRAIVFDQFGNETSSEIMEFTTKEGGGNAEIHLALDSIKWEQLRFITGGPVGLGINFVLENSGLGDANNIIITDISTTNFVEHADQKNDNGEILITKSISKESKLKIKLHYIVPETVNNFNTEIDLSYITNGELFSETFPFSINVPISYKISTPDGDIDNDGDVDIDDINVIKTYANQPASANPDADIDGDGMITVMDARMLMMDCTLPRCARP